MAFKKRLAYPLFSLLFLIANVCLSQSFSVDNSYINIGNDSIQFKFQKLDGELYSLVDKTTSTEFIKEKNTNWSLFYLRVKINGGDAIVGGWVGNNFTYDTIKKANSITLNLHWASFQNNGTLNIAANVSIEVPAHLATTSWGIDLVNH